MKKLVITIPTYNEFNYLKVNLSTLIPQINKHKKNVDLYLFDNNSSSTFPKRPYPIIPTFFTLSSSFFLLLKIM